MDPPPAPSLPGYGQRSLAEVVPSLLSALGVTGFENPLRIEPMKAFCLLVIDGLGSEQLAANREVAPFLAGAAAGGAPVTASFPTTTAASLGSLGTGLPPGEHGMIGYTFAVPGHDRAMNALLWELYGIGPHVDLRQTIVPEEFQPVPTALERAAAAGAVVTRVGPAPHEESGFTRAILRGGPYRGAYWPHEVAAAVFAALRIGPGSSVYAYQPDLDTAGHSKGVRSNEWTAQLGRLDELVEDMANRLRPRESLFVTGDHGMVDIAPEGKLDLADRPALSEGVRLLAGEARARHVYARPGAAGDVASAWRQLLGDRMWIRTRDEAIDEGWFGPRVADRVRQRIGDVVAAAFAPMGVFQRAVDPFHATLVGHHGSLTPAELDVPLLEFRG